MIYELSNDFFMQVCGEEKFVTIGDIGLGDVPTDTRVARVAGTHC